MREPNDTGTPPRAGAPRWMQILLVASLAVNLLVLGALAGSALMGGGRWHGSDHHTGPMARALSDEDRRILRERMRSARSEGQGGHRAHRAALEQLLTQLRATPYDGAAVEAQLRAVRGHFMERMERGQALLATRFAEMSPAERAAYADRLEAALRKGPHR